MPGAVLIEALRRRAAEQVRELWSQAETEAESLKRAHAVRLEQLRNSSLLQADSAGKDFARERLAQAEKEGREVVAQAKQRLAARLRILAEAALATLWREGDETLFSPLAEELPGTRWERIRVRPADGKLAETIFPQATIDTDPGFSGGLEAWAAEGAVHIDNSLEKRLQRAWPNLVSAMIEELIHDIQSHDPAP